MSDFLKLLKSREESKNYPSSDSDYQAKLFRSLLTLDEPLERSLKKQEYWKDSNFEFLNQNWLLEEMESKIKNPPNNIANDSLQSNKKEDFQFMYSEDYYDIFFKNGVFHSADQELQDGTISVYHSSEGIEKFRQVKNNLLSGFKKIPDKNWFINLNELCNEQFVFLNINGKKNRPLRLVFVNQNNATITSPQIIIHLSSGSQLSLLEKHIPLDSLTQDNANRQTPPPLFNNYSIKIIGEEKSIMEHFYFQNESLQSHHIHHCHIELYHQAKYFSYVLQKGSKSSIVQRSVAFIEPEGEVGLYGVSHVGEDQDHNNITRIDHATPNCKSDQLYNGVLDGKSHLSFTGNVRVAKDAQLTNSSQLNNNLILSDDATMNTRPELEIHADDVKCSHGATSRNFNSDELFYLRSRGLSLEKAKLFLIKAFTADFFDLIKKPFPKWNLNEQ